MRPERVSYITVYKHAQKWFKRGLFRDAYTTVLRWYRRHHPAKFYCIDSTMIKNRHGVDCTGRNPTDRGRRGTKLTTITDHNGVANSVHFTGANVSDYTLLEAGLRRCMEPLERLELFADRGYASRANSRICVAYGLRDRIFRKKTKTTRRSNAKRGTIERSYSWVDNYRRLLIRYEKRVNTYAEMLYMCLGHMLCRRFLGTPM